MPRPWESEIETTSRGEELKALATAKKIIKETISRAAGQSYGFLQMSSSSSDSVRFVRQLAKKQRSSVLAHLASRMASEVAAHDDLAQEMTHDLEMNFNKIALQFS